MLDDHGLKGYGHWDTQAALLGYQGQKRDQLFEKTRRNSWFRNWLSFHAKKDVLYLVGIDANGYQRKN